MSEASGPSELIYRRARSRSDGLRSRVNSVLAILLCFIVFAAPIALGSNRPLPWAFWAIVVGATTVVVALAMARSGERFRVGLSQLWPETALFGLLIAYLLVQQIPFGSFAIHNPLGLELSASQISVAPGATLLMTLRMLTYGLFGFLFLQASANSARRNLMLDAILLIVVLHALYSLLALFQFSDTLLGAEKSTYLGSATGTFINRNSFATFIALGAGLASARIAYAFIAPDRQRQGTNLVLYIVALAILLVTEIATNSRMGLVVWVVAVTIPPVALLARNGVSKAFVGLVLLGVTLAATLALIYYGAGLVERIGGLERDAGLRGTLYAQVWQMVQTRPWIGYGGGSFENAFYLIHSPDLNVDMNWDRAHNTYLGLWAELGLIAGTMPMLILGLVGWRIMSKLGGDDAAWPAQAAALSALGVGAVHSLVDFSLEMQANTLLFIAICAMGLSASLKRRGA